MHGLPRSVARRNPGSAAAAVIKQIIPVIGKPLTVTDPGAALAWGSVVIGDIPEGNVLLLGAVAYMKFTTVAAGVIATFDGFFAVGSAPSVSNIALATDKADFIASIALGAATAKVSPLVRATNAVQSILDNTDGTLEVNLNLLIADASISATSAFTADGVVILSYTVLGDD